MKVTMDAAGRIVVPKPLRDALHLRPGVVVHVSRYGSGLILMPADLLGRLVDEDGVLVASGHTVIDDAEVFALIDAERR